MNYLKLLIKTIITCALIYLLLINIDIKSAIDTVKDANLFFILISIIALFLQTFLLVSKWYVLLPDDHTFFEAAKSYMIGIFIGSFTPLYSGEVSRGLYLKKDYLSKYIYLTIIDKYISLSIVIIFSLIGFIILTKNLLFIILIVPIFIVTINFQKIILYLGKIKFLEKRKWLSTILLFFNNNNISIRSLLWNILLTFFSFIVLFCQEFLVIKSFYNDLPPIIITYFPLITLSSIFPLTISGIGVREGLAAILFTRHNIPQEVAVTSIFIWFLIAQIIPAIIGGLIFMFSRSSLKKYKIIKN